MFHHISSSTAVPWNLVYAAIVVAITLIIAFINKHMYDQRMASVTYSPTIASQVQHLISEAARWNATAQQDTNAALALMHSTYAVAYLNAARALMDDGEIMKTAGVHVPEMNMVLSGTQQTSYQALSAQCPSAVPEDSDGYSLYTGYLA